MAKSNIFNWINAVQGAISPDSNTSFTTDTTSGDTYWNQDTDSPLTGFAKGFAGLNKQSGTGANNWQQFIGNYLKNNVGKDEGLFSTIAKFFV
jgi:hypothetical protein